MFRCGDADAFYPDLASPAFEAAVAIFHARYSTNTFPEWRLAQPFRMLAHNGEINTLRGNVNWMRSHEIRMAAAAFGGQQEQEAGDPPGSSDSAALDNVSRCWCAPALGADGQGAADPGGLGQADAVMKPEHRRSTPTATR